MTKIWMYFKRFGLPMLRRIKDVSVVLILLGMAFLLIGIWWLGPEWRWGETKPLAPLSMRVLASVLVALVPTLLWALILRSRNRRYEQQQRQSQKLEDDPLLRYVEAQQRSLDSSLKLLREHLRGPNALYQLPWYLVLGQENSGKTSFINRSEQNFTLTGIRKAGRRAQQDPDLAYTVDWWMGDQAVLIDPPGELISQTGVPGADEDSGTNVATVPADLQGRLWAHLVDWLGQNRSRRPLNGVVLMVDIPYLLSQNASDRKALAILLRARLYELSQHLGTRPPLYVVLSKFDMLQGFDAFFAHLSRSAREEIFGFTFSLSSVTDFDAWLRELGQRYDDFLVRTNEQVFDALNESNNLEQREGLFSLIRQLSGLRPILLSFLSDVLGSDRYSTPALVRGMYFSSVYQQGLLANAFVRSAAEAYGLEAPVPESHPDGRSVVYFAQRLFQQVIYPEAGLAGDNVNVLANKRRTLLISGGVVTLGAMLVIAGWQHYYGINREKASLVLSKSREFSTVNIDGRLDSTGRNLLDPLDQIRDAVTIYGDYREAWPIVADMGLYQGKEIGPKVDQAYLQLLSRRFLPALASGVMADIKAAPPKSNEQLASLRVYRMIEDRENRRPAIVREWMARKWQAAFPGDGAVQNALLRHLDYALLYADTDLPQYREDVAQAQRQLREIPLPQRVYMTMKAQAGESLHAPLDLRNEIGPSFDIVYQDRANVPGETSATLIDALLTARGFRDYFVPRTEDAAELAMIDQWVLGERQRINYSEADKHALAERLRAIYSADYIDTWRRGLAQLEVTNFTDIRQAVSVLENVTGSSVPLRRLADTVRDNSIVYPPVTDAAAASKAPELTPEQRAARQLASNIATAFAPVDNLIVGKNNQPAYLDETMQVVGSLYETMKGVQDSPDQGTAALDVVLNRFALKGPDPIGNLQRIANGLPEPFNRHVKKLADASSEVLLIKALGELERRWDQEVYSFYRQRLAGRYPFNPASRDDVALDDFEAFFGPSGILQKFSDQYLNLFLKSNLDALYSQRLGGYLVRTDVLTQLEAANRIRDAFFNNRGALAVQFTVEPLGLTANRRSSVLGVDGQLVPYNHGPSTSTSLIWPNTLTAANTESRITLVNNTGNSSGLAYRGPWALFRLLSQARLEASSNTNVDLSFVAGDGAMRYRISAEKANNPFTQRPFAGFVLPRTLLQEAATVHNEINRLPPQS